MTHWRGRAQPPSEVRLGRMAVFVVIVVVAMIVGATVGYWLRPAPALPELDGPGPTGWTDGVPTGYARTRKGAASAAINHLVALYDQGVARDQRDRVLGVVAADGAVDRLDAHITEAQGPNADPDWPTARGGGLGYHVVSYTDDRATVEVWLAASAAGGDMWGLREVAGRVTRVELAWGDGDWRIAYARLLQVDEEVEARMEDYEEVWHVPAS